MNWRSVERRAQSRKGEMRRAGQKERRTAASLAEFWQKVVVRVHRRQASAAARLSETLPSPLRGSDLPDPVCHRLPPATMKQQKNIWVAAGDGDLERVRELIEHQGDSPNARDPFTYTPMFVFSRCHRHPHSFFTRHAAASYGQRHVLQYLIGCGMTHLHLRLTPQALINPPRR